MENPEVISEHRFQVTFVPFDEADNLRIDNDGKLFISDLERRPDSDEIMQAKEYRRATGDRLISEKEFRIEQDGFSAVEQQYGSVFLEFMVNQEKGSKCVIGLAALDSVLKHTKDKFLASIQSE